MEKTNNLFLKYINRCSCGGLFVLFFLLTTSLFVASNGWDVFLNPENGHVKGERVKMSGTYYLQYTKNDNTTMEYYAYCGSPVDCVGTDELCYASGTRPFANKRFVCQGGKWYECNQSSDVGQHINIYSCQESSGGYTWELYEEDQPDLIVSSINLYKNDRVTELESPTLINEGSTIYYTITFKNEGVGDSESFHYSLSITTQNTLSGHVSLPLEQNETFTTPGVNLQIWHAGTYEFTVMADSQNILSETDETDNSLTESIFVNIGPEPVVCTDSDEGKIYDVKGTGQGIHADDEPGDYKIYGHKSNPLTPQTTTNKYSTHYDYCLDSAQLSEAFCNNDNRLASYTYDCPYGCQNGVCLTQEQQQNQEVEQPEPEPTPAPTPEPQPEADEPLAQEPSPTPSTPATSNISISFSKRLAGRLLLQVEQGGAIWYVDHQNYKRHSVTWSNALPLFEKLAMGISDEDLIKIPAQTSSIDPNLDSDNDGYGDKIELEDGYHPYSSSLNKITFDNNLANRLKGQLLLQVEQGGAIWYVDQEGVRHNVRWSNLMDLFRGLALGITDNDLNKIGVEN